MTGSAFAPLPAELAAVHPWPVTRFAAPHGEIAVLDVGPRDAPVMLALHGNPTWSFYWRALISAFSDRFRVIVPDHLGAGRSSKPQDAAYRLHQHVDNVIALIEALDLRDITLVVHDWGGAIGMGAATRQPERFSRFVITNTAAFRSLRIPPSIALCKVPGFGALAVRGANAFAGIATVRATAKGLSDIARRGLLWPYGSWHDRIVTLRFVQDIPLGPWHPSYPELSRIDDGLAGLTDRPMLILWGDQDFCFSPAFRAEWSQRFPNATVHAWADVGHYVMEDAPERAVAAISTFLASSA